MSAVMLQRESVVLEAVQLAFQANACRPVFPYHVYSWQETYDSIRGLRRVMARMAENGKLHRVGYRRGYQLVA